MAISIPVAATADDRTFQQIATRYEKWGKDTGKKIGASLADGIDDPKIERAFSKVGDAMSKVRAEEAKLQDLRQRGASDNRIAVQSEALARARTAEARATNDAIRAYDGMTASTSRLSAATGTLTGMLSGTRFGALAADVSNLSSKFGALGGVTGGAVLGVTAIGTAAIVAGKQLYDMGKAWDDTVDSITGKTGLVGSQLTALTDTVKSLASTTALPIESIGEIAGSVAQSLDLTGDSAEQMIQTLSQIQQLTGQGVDTRGLGKAFRLFDIKDTAAQTDAVEDLLKVSQATGISINELVGAVQSGGKAAKEFGLDFSQTAGLISTMEEAGLDFTRTAPSLSIALKNFAKDGREPQQALRDTIAEIKALSDAQQDSAAIDLAQKTFGKGYVDFLNAIKDGHLTVEDLNDALSATGASLQDQISATEDWAEEWTKLSNRLTTEFEPTASLVFSTVGKYIEDYLLLPLRGVQGLVGLFQPGGQGFGNAGINAPAPIAPGSPLGNMLLPGGPGAPPGTGLGDILRGGPGAAAAPKGLWDTISQVDAGSGDWFKGADNSLWHQPDKDKSGSKGPTMPVLPTTGDPLSLLQGFPATSSLYGAADSVITARNARAQAEAELHALEQSNEATAEQIQAAKNKITKADGDIYQAELRLQEAKISSTQKFTNQMKDATGALNELGAGLDKDLGISKGLAGMADNLVRFLGSIAAAPMMGQLNAMSAAQGGIGATGSGLMGYLAQQGAFGPQFTPEAIAAAQAAQSGGYASGYAPSGSASGGSGLFPQFAAKPGESARDFAHDTMKPFWESLGLTVGDHAADGHQEHQNGALDIMVDSLQEGNAVLQQVLSDPNAYGAIFNNQTYGYGHGSTPQDYSDGHTGDPTQDHTNHVHVWYGDGNRSGAVMPGGGTSGGLASSLFQDANGQWRSSMSGWDHLIQRESSGINQRQGITDANSGGNEAEGLFQITPKTWAAHGGTQFAPSALGATPQQQAQIAAAIFGANPSGSDWGAGLPGREDPSQLQSELLGMPRVSYDGGGPLNPGWTAVVNKTGQQEHVVNPQGMVGNTHVSQMFPGPGPGGATPGNASAAIGQQGPTQIGGAEKKAVPGGGASAGAGALGMATSAAAMAADAFAPGSGQAVQVAGKLAERAIRFGGQLAGVGVQGLMETFLPTGGSELANNNWLTRIGGAFAGASPQLPNVAGKPSTPVPQQAPVQPMPFPTAPGASQNAGGDQRPIQVNLNGVGNVDQTSLNHFTGDISRAVNMPGWAR